MSSAGGDDYHSDGNTSPSNYAESVGQHSTLKPSVAAAQPTKIMTPNDDERDSEKIASAMAERHTGDSTAFRRVDPPLQDEGKKKETGDAEESKGSVVDKWKSGVVASGIAMAVLGAVLAIATALRGKSRRD